MTMKYKIFYGLIMESQLCIGTNVTESQMARQSMLLYYLRCSVVITAISNKYAMNAASATCVTEW